MPGVQIPPPLISFMKNLYPRFLKNIIDNRLIEKGDTVISGFSGGKDSVSLLLLLKELQKDIDFKLIAAYFNHKLRVDSDNEEKWIEEFMNVNNIKLIKGKGNVILFKEENKLNLENAASLSRYDFFNKVSKKYNSAKIATGHSKSDLTETFFIKLFRGSGLQGLSGIYGLKGERIIRPLLIFSKSEILDFLKRSTVKFYSDPTNESDTFLRNNIRNNLIPEIERIVPEIDDHIFRTVTIIQDEFEFFKKLATDFLDRNIICNKIIPLKKLKIQQTALKRHIIREYIRKLKGNLLNIKFDHIKSILDNNGEMSGISIPGVNLFIKKGFLYPESIKLDRFEYKFDTPGIYEIKEIDTQLAIEVRTSYVKPKNNFEFVIPYDVKPFTITVRNPEKGDKYRKINSQISQKVFEMIRSSGIPSDLRNLQPVLLDKRQKIIGVSGSPISEDFKVKDKKNEKYLSLKFRSPLL